ncbi:MAG: hypothetical protein NZ534_12275, partial [Bacteroidia bacterium]|nr:hypothetical protein [Bacteroidia bacterium]
MRTSAIPAIQNPGSICANALPVVLSAVPQGGTFSGPGVVGNTFNPSGLSGPVSISYSGFNNGCFYSTSTIVNVHPAPTPSISGLANVFCTGQLCVQLTGVPSGGTFSGPGVTTENRFCPGVAGPGTHVVTYSGFDANGCAYTTSRTVVVNSTPVATLSGLNPEYCPTDGCVVMTGVPSGGQFLGPGVVGSRFCPALAGPGVHAVRYRGNVDGCFFQTTVSVRVKATPTASIAGLAQTYCVSTPCATLTGVPSGGTFSGPGVSGSTFCPLAAGPGTHTITYSGAVEGCAFSTSQTVTVFAVPTAAIAGLSAEHCLDGPCQSLSGFPSGGQFFGPGVSGGEFCPALAGAGIHTVVYRGQRDGCAYEVAQTVRVKPIPVATITA